MERNITLDYFKLVLSILVITIHLPIEMSDNQFFSIGIIFFINKIAVPSFFILNGFFIAERINKRSSVIKYLKKLLILILTWNLIYIYIIPMPILNFFQKLSVLFLGSFHLWYLSALFGAIILLFILVNKFTQKCRFLLAISFTLLIMGFLIELYTNSKEKMSFFEPYEYKNFLFFGFPFVSLGYLLNTQKEFLSHFKIKLLTILSSILLIVFFGEVIFIKHLGLLLDFYISLFFLCPVLLMLILKFSKLEITDGYIGNLSQAIYFIHPLSITLVIGAMSLNYFEGISSIMLLPIILFFTSIFAAGIIEINKRIKIFL